MGFNWLYHVLFESSKLRATPGKLLMGVQVVDAHGMRASFLRATARHFGKVLSAVILTAGFLASAVRKDRRTWHDLISGTAVVDKTSLLRD